MENAKMNLVLLLVVPDPNGNAEETPSMYNEIRLHLGHTEILGVYGMNK
jgi:hypothetical protein